jgi:hypothetical protein
MIGIQCFAPIHLPTAAEGGWKRTKVTKKRDTARLRSSGVAPMSAVKPVGNVVSFESAKAN